MIITKQKQRSRDNINLEIIVVANSILAHTAIQATIIVRYVQSCNPQIAEM